MDIFKVFLEFITILLLSFGILALRPRGSLLPDQGLNLYPLH